MFKRQAYEDHWDGYTYTSMNPFVSVGGSRRICNYKLCVINVSWYSFETNSHFVWHRLLLWYFSME